MSSVSMDEDLIRIRAAWQRDTFSLDVDVALPRPRVTGIFGPSGAGKSTLLRCLAGLESPDRIEFHVGRETIDEGRPETRIAVHQRRIGYVFQEPRLFAHLDVGGNLDGRAPSRTHWSFQAGRQRCV